MWRVEGKHVVCRFFKGDAVETGSQPEDAADDVLQLEVGAQHLGIEIIALHLELVGVVGDVPGLQLEVVALVAARHLLYLFHLVDGSGLVSLDEVIEQTIDIGGIGRHALHQHIVGIGIISQQLCHLAAQIDQPFAYLQIVLLVVVGTYGHVGHIHLTTQVAPVGIGHEGRIAGEVEREHPTLLVLLGSSLGGSLTLCVGQSAQLCFVGDVQLICLVLLQQVLRELQREHAGFFGQPAQLLLVLVTEQGTAAHKSVVRGLQQHTLLGRELTMVLIDILDALKETTVERHVVGVLGEYGIELLGQGVHLITGLGTEHAREHARHAVEQIIIMLALAQVHSGESILKGGFLGVVDELVDSLIVTAYTLHERLFIVFGLYSIKRNSVVRGVIRQEKGIFLSFVYICCNVHTIRS